MLKRAGETGDKSISARSRLPRIAINRLLKSCAMPPANTPRLSSLCVWSSRRSISSRSSSRRLRSPISEAIVTKQACPSTVTGAADIKMSTNSPVFLRHLTSRFRTRPCALSRLMARSRSAVADHSPISTEVRPMLSRSKPSSFVKVSLNSRIRPSSSVVTAMNSGLARKISASLRSLLRSASSARLRSVMS